MDSRRIMLDTSAYSNFLRGNAEIKLAVQYAEEIYLNPVIIGELLAGFLTGKSEKKNRAVLQEFLTSSRVHIVEIDEETSERYAIIVKYLRTKGTAVPTNDVWIAASAMQHGLIVVTSDNHYFKISQIITAYHQGE